MSMLRDIFVSAVLIQPEGGNLLEKLKEIRAVLASHYAHHEVLIIDPEENRKLDAEIVDNILKMVSGVRYLKLFNTMSDKVLFAAGMENAIGDVIVTGYPEFFSEENIVRAVELCCEGNDVVIGTFPARRSLLYRTGSFLFRMFFARMISYRLPADDAYFRAISRRILNAALCMKHFHEFVFLRLSNVGGKQALLELGAPKGPCSRKQSKGMFSKAVSLVIFNTTTPLRIMNGIALFSSFLALLAAFYTVIVKLLKNHVVEGWPTMMLLLSVLFFLLFLILSFLGEYLVRIIFDHGASQPYNVIQEKHSSVMLDYSELNIREDSVSSSINLTQTGRDR